MRAAKGFTRGYCRTLWYICFACLVFNLSCQSAKPGLIQGEITDFDNDREVLKEVKIVARFSDGHTEAVRSDDNGFFQFDKVQSGNVSLLFTLSGYESLSRDIIVAPAGWVKLMGDDKLRMAERCDLSLDGWAEDNASRVAEIFKKRQYSDLNIALTFYRKSGNGVRPVPQLIKAFMTELNARIDNKIRLVIGDLNEEEILRNYVEEQQLYKVDFNPQTVASMGKKIGANVVLLCELEQRKRVFRTWLNGVDVAEQAAIPGISTMSCLRLSDISLAD